jgi:ligand-binding sensor domain-containing protein/class 3 adenylate cyclase
MRHRLVPALLLVAAPCLAPAQQYDLRTFSLEQGLPSASVNAMCEDADGFLWVATDQGLGRSQGLRFEAFTRSQGLPGDEATAMVAGPGSAIWIGFGNGRLASWHEGRAETWSGTGLPARAIRTLALDRSGALWVAQRGGGLFRIEPGAHQATASANGLPAPRVNDLTMLHDGRLLAATDSGLAVLAGNRWQSLPQALAPGARALALHADSLGVLVGTSQGYVELDAQLQPLPVHQRFAGYQPLALPHPVVLSVLRTAHGDLWLGTPAGVARLERRGGVPSMQVITEANGLGHDLARCLHQDRSGGIWIGTAFGGVTKFTSAAFLYFTERDGLRSRIVSAIHRTADGLLWLGTQGGGVASWDGRSVRAYGRADGLPSLFITCLGEDAHGHLLAGTAMHGLHRLRNDRFEPVLHAGTLEGDRVHAIASDAHGHAWVGTANGMWHEERDGRFVQAPIGNGAITAVLVADDTLWTGTDSGLVAWPMPFGTAAPLRHPAVPAVLVTSLARDSHGSLWIGTASDGLYRVLGQRKAHYGTDEGLQSLAVESLVLDAWENLWVGTRRGIHQVELDAQQEQVLGIKAYGPDDGFIGIESLRGAGWLDGDSALWFGTVRGAIRYDARQQVDDPREPLVHLTELQLFYEKPDWTPWCQRVGADGLPAGLELPHDRNHLTFAFTGISLAFPEKVRYRWILEGHDPDWSPITATQRVTYSNIPPGSYTFKVMARNASGIWNEAPIAFSFTIAPPFWQTPTFRFGGGALLLLAGFGLVRVRERRLRRDRERLEAMVAHRTRELATEKDRSERLLLNILPASTAEELKAKGSAEARRIERCTVLFSDFKGFTDFSSRMDSDTLVSELHHYFGLFDALCDRYGVEKIKTIGDAYMCAAGLPEPATDHALRALLLAFGILHAVDRSNAERRAKGLQEWPIRIGLHSGPVVAGVVGEKKFAYDIWGDTVNLASRMEANSEAGRINISGPVYAQVMEYIDAVPRGPIKVKGKGEVQMYFALRLKPRYSADAVGLLPNEDLVRALQGA